MRLWSLHPKYLDPQGLVALWREGLLAKKVLDGNTKGYRNHPQLNRFKDSKNPQLLIATYLHMICDEAVLRGYSFDRSKLGRRKKLRSKISVTEGQLIYEWRHLKRKLRARSRRIYLDVRSLKQPEQHPLFKLVGGTIEAWEIR